MSTTKESYVSHPVTVVNTKEIEDLKAENEELKAENYTLRLDLSIYQEALFQDEENKENGNLVFQFCFEYSYETDEYKCYSKHFSDEIVENDFAYFIVENYEQSCRNVKEVLKRRE